MISGDSKKVGGVEYTNRESRSSSFVEAMFSRDAVKIRPDVLKNIPLTTSPKTVLTISKTYTSASISSSDSVKSSPIGNKREKFVRRKSTSLDGE